MQRTQKYTVDGTTYESVDAMPADVRVRWEKFARQLHAMAAVGADVASSPSKTRTYRYEETVAYGPGETAERPFRGVTPEGLSIPTMPFNDRMPDPFAHAKPDKRIKIIAAASLLTMFAVMFLAMWGMYTRTRITMNYGMSWWVVSTLVWLGLTAGLLWVWKRRRIDPFRHDQERRIDLKMLLGTALGMSAISYLGILGGGPVLAHFLTARHGALVVTVTGKSSHYEKRACTPRLYVAEFTYGPKNYLCPSDRAFAAIGVGAKVRIEGDLSWFGITPYFITW